MDNEEYRCICCNKVKNTLIAVNCKIDSGGFFMRNRGVCKECLLNPDLDIDKLQREFKIRKLKEEIDQKKDSLRFMEEEMEKFKNG